MFNRSIALAGLSSLALCRGLHPGILAALGGKAPATGRVYGDANIRRAISHARKGIDHARLGRTSLADRPHEHRMERARRLTKPGTVGRHTAEMAARTGFMP